MYSLRPDVVTSSPQHTSRDPDAVTSSRRAARRRRTAREPGGATAAAGAAGTGAPLLHVVSRIELPLHEYEFDSREYSHNPSTQVPEEAIWVSLEKKINL